MTVIGNFRREAALAEQLRLARAGNSRQGPSVGTLFGFVRRGFAQGAASRSRSMGLPSETAVIK